MINVILADDHTMLREGISRIISESHDIQCIAEAANFIEAMEVIKQNKPDVAIIDISMPGRNGIELILELRKCYATMPILVLTMHEEQSFVVRALRAGANGYVTKKSAPNQLINAIRKVYSGLPFLVDSAADAVALRLQNLDHHEDEIDLLTEREMQILEQLALGYTNQEIGTVFHISARTVQTHRFNILKKLKLRNNADITRFAIIHNLINI